MRRVFTGLFAALVWIGGVGVFLIFISIMFSGAASAATFVQYCNSNPGPGMGCPSPVYGPLETPAPVGTFIPGMTGTVFTGTANVQYFSTTGSVGLLMLSFCEAPAVSDCASGSNGPVYSWAVGSVRGAGQVTKWSMSAGIGAGQFGLTAQQDILFALGICVCGLIGVGVGVRLL